LLIEEGKKEIKSILKTEITYEGHFKKVFSNLKETKQKELIDWINKCNQNRKLPLQSKKDPELIGFIMKFRETNLRAILTKKKNKYFITPFLDNHKYYDRERSKLGI